MNMKLILLGAPGAGKGTQAEILSERLNIPTISTGNIIREALKNGTEMGLKAKSFMDAGQLVPDDVVIGIDHRVVVVQRHDGTAKEEEDHTQEQGDHHAEAPCPVAICLRQVGALFPQALAHQAGGRGGKGLAIHKRQRLDIHAHLMGGESHSSQTSHGLGEDDQLAQCQRLLEEQRAQAQEEKTSKGNLFRSLGMLGGAGLFILFL